MRLTLPVSSSVMTYNAWWIGTPGHCLRAVDNLIQIVASQLLRPSFLLIQIPDSSAVLVSPDRGRLVFDAQQYHRLAHKNRARGVARPQNRAHHFVTLFAPQPA